MVRSFPGGRFQTMRWTVSYCPGGGSLLSGALDEGVCILSDLRTGREMLRFPGQLGIFANPDLAFLLNEDQTALVPLEAPGLKVISR